ncbi:tyrosine-type recombinase/integrase [Paraurantiacibacter namhicola]|uniref:Site-specific tyrosine recombinase XerC n=1 Tax=Paraurantiacibacter namhicola TaxID=645517 RepID=A0A1C7DB32_9SPHN|nr:site-specific integrase [Paraurantiacibacter namhicola]ANU08696.1 site-specific tyrosine recombinase XerC [Paraurantiacibacter namhicola]
MRRAPARVLEPADVRRLYTHVGRLRHPLRNQIIVLASFKAGLRACEISQLTWPMVLRSDGKIADALTVPGAIAKYGSGRIIPLQLELKKALRQHHQASGSPRSGFIVQSERGGAMTSQSIVNWFAAIYRDLGIDGASSHSGRRTFITTAARSLSKVGGSLRDVQELAGHRALSTTERYIQGDRDAQRKLIKLI